MSIYFIVKGVIKVWTMFFPTLDVTEETYILTNSGEIQYIIFFLFILVLVCISCYLMETFVVLINREGFNLAYSILPLSSVAMCIWIVSEIFSINIFLKNIFTSVVLYIPLMFLSYLLYSKIYRNLNQYVLSDYILIHGASLIHGAPSPILKDRLNKGIELFNSFQKKPMFIVSGGKGEGECISESEAMKNYLIRKGISEEKIIEENQSRNTYENLLFSKKIINDSSKTITIVSNEFHILRCVIYAENMGLKVHGIGCRTVKYYRVFGEIRELLAFLVRYKMYFFFYISSVVLVSFFDAIFKY